MLPCYGILSRGVVFPQKLEGIAFWLSASDVAAKKFNAVLIPDALCERCSFFFPFLRTLTIFSRCLVALYFMMRYLGMSQLSSIALDTLWGTLTSQTIKPLGPGKFGGVI